MTLFMRSHDTFLQVVRPWFWYFRIRGWGFSFQVSRDPWRSFSERHGYIKVHHFGPVRLQVLRPTRKPT